MARSARTQTRQEESSVRPGGQDRPYGLSPDAQAAGVRCQTVLRQLTTNTQRTLTYSPGHADHGQQLNQPRPSTASWTPNSCAMERAHRVSLHLVHDPSTTHVCHTPP